MLTIRSNLVGAHLRNATVDDAPRLAEIVTASWRLAYRGLLPDEVLDRDWQAERTARMRRRIDTVPTFVAVVDDPPKPAAPPPGEREALGLAPDASALRADRPDARSLRGDGPAARGVVGFACLGPVASHGYDAEIDGLYVDPRIARGGIGRALVSHTCSHLAASGKRTLYIHTMRGNRIGRAFYEKLGGRIIIEDTWSFEGTAYPAVGYLWDDLRSLISLTA